jgi:hypothetical protein
MSKSPIRKLCEERLGTKIKPGDQLKYENSGGLFSSMPNSYTYHPTIYIGDDEVVHATTHKNGKTGEIKKNALRTAKLIENAGQNNANNNSDKIVVQACKSIGKTYEYDVSNNNCQHFIDYCFGNGKTGFFVKVSGDTIDSGYTSGSNDDFSSGCNIF